MDYTRTARYLRRIHRVEASINVLLVLNLVAALLLTSAQARSRWGMELDVFCDVSIVVFIIEVLCRVFMRPSRDGVHSFFVKDGKVRYWNVFDLVVTLISAVSIVGGVMGLVGVRTLRLLKLASTSKVLVRQRHLHELTEAIFGAVPAILGASLYILFVTTIYAIIGVNLYRDTAPAYFGTLGDTYLTLFQLMLLDDWGQIIRPLLPSHPWAWCYAVSFTVIANFVLLNIILGYIVDSIQHIRALREYRSRQGLLHESDLLQEQLERFERAFTRFKESQTANSGSAAAPPASQQL